MDSALNMACGFYHPSRRGARRAPKQPKCFRVCPGRASISRLSLTHCATVKFAIPPAAHSSDSEARSSRKLGGSSGLRASPLAPSRRAHSLKFRDKPSSLQVACPLTQRLFNPGPSRSGPQAQALAVSPSPRPAALAPSESPGPPKTCALPGPP
eukprot:1355316-Rhodomonas_salina.3